MPAQRMQIRKRIVEFVISFDMRAPAFGAPAQSLYDAALDVCVWADEIGFDALGLGEHHASGDGYLPLPIPMASAKKQSWASIDWVSDCVGVHD